MCGLLGNAIFSAQAIIPLANKERHISLENLDMDNFGMEGAVFAYVQKQPL